MQVRRRQNHMVFIGSRPPPWPRNKVAAAARLTRARLVNTSSGDVSTGVNTLSTRVLNKAAVRICIYCLNPMPASTVTPALPLPLVHILPMHHGLNINLRPGWTSPPARSGPVSLHALESFRSRKAAQPSNPARAGRREHEHCQLWTRGANKDVVCLCT